jgi:hypothetical protein
MLIRTLAIIIFTISTLIAYWSLKMVNKEVAGKFAQLTNYILTREEI